MNAFDQFDRNDFDQFDARPSVVEDVGRSVASGVVRGVPNLINTAAAAANAGIDYAQGKPFDFTGYAKHDPTDLALGEQYQPQTGPGRVAKAMAEGAVVAPAFGGASALNAVRGALGGAGAVVGGDVGEDVAGTPGRVAGTLIGGAAGFPAGSLAARAHAVVSRAAVPTISEETARLAQRAKDFEIPLSLNQIAPTRTRGTIQKISQAIPLSGVQGFEEGQVASWNKALGKTIGLDTPKLTPESVNEYLSKTSKGYDDALKGTNIRFRKDALDNIRNVGSEAYKSMDRSLADTVLSNVDETVAQLKNGFINGEKIASIRKSLVNRASKATGEVREAIGDIVSHIDSTIESSIPAERVDAIKTLNRQYRNFKTMEPLLEKSTDGTLNPTDLLQRVASSKYIKGSRTAIGDDDLVDLARIGKLMPKLGGSDTFEKGALAAAGAAAYAEPTAAAATVGGNRAFQKLYNQSPKLVSKAIDKSLNGGKR